MAWPASVTLRAWIWMVRVEWRRRRDSFDDLVAWLESVPQGERRSVPAARVLVAVRRAYALSPFHPSCLKVSLVALGLLRSLGHPARLAIGVKPLAGALDAHAWLEVDGAPLDPKAPSYAPLRWPGSI